MIFSENRSPLIGPWPEGMFFRIALSSFSVRFKRGWRGSVGGIDRRIGGKARGLGGPELGQENRYRARKRLRLLQVGIHRNGLGLGIPRESADDAREPLDRRIKLDFD